MRELEQRQIGFKSLAEQIDTTTSGGKLVFPIFGALAEFERDLIYGNAIKARGTMSQVARQLDRQDL